MNPMNPMKLVHRMRMRTRIALALGAGGVALAVQLAQPLTASAQWSAQGAGTAGGAATMMPTGAKPSAGAANGSVSVSWTAVTMGNGAAVSGYVVKRYNAINGTLATIGAGCSGVITTTSCTERSVPSGTWVYTETPVQMNWNGTESTPSGAVSIP